MDFPLELAEIAETLEIEDLNESLVESDLHLLLSLPDLRPPYTHYTNLDVTRKEIRLLKIWKLSGDDNIHAHLAVASLLDGPDYIAISYYWGPPDKGNVIYVDDEPVLIRESLFLFLDKLATRGQALPIWVDALCINQNDTRERNEQVSLMSDIYRNAEKVIAWIGEATTDSEYALAFVQNHRHPELLQSKFYLDVKRRARESLFHILGRPYWKRVWIVQEISLGKVLHIMCGDRIIEWFQFVSAAHAILELPEHWYDRWGVVDESALDKYDHSERILIDNLLHLARVRNHRRKAYATFYTSLAEIVIDFGSHNCSEVKDKFYGFASLIPRHRLVIDYDKSFADIFFDVLDKAKCNVIMDDDGHTINEELNISIGVPFSFPSLQNLGCRLLFALHLSNTRTQLFRSLQGSEYPHPRSRLIDFNYSREQDTPDTANKLWKFWPVQSDDVPISDRDYPFVIGEDASHDPVVVLRSESHKLRCVGVCTQDPEKDHLSKFLRHSIRRGEIQLCDIVDLDPKQPTCRLFFHHSLVSILASFDDEECAEGHFQLHRNRYPLMSLCTCDASADQSSRALRAFHQARDHFKPQWTNRVDSFIFASEKDDDSSVWNYTNRPLLSIA